MKFYRNKQNSILEKEIEKNNIENQISPNNVTKPVATDMSPVMYKKVKRLVEGAWQEEE